MDTEEIGVRGRGRQCRVGSARAALADSVLDRLGQVRVVPPSRCSPMAASDPIQSSNPPPARTARAPDPCIDSTHKSVEKVRVGTSRDARMGRNAESCSLHTRVCGVKARHGSKCGGRSGGLVPRNSTYHWPRGVTSRLFQRGVTDPTVQNESSKLGSRTLPRQQAMPAWNTCSITISEYCGYLGSKGISGRKGYEDVGVDLLKPPQYILLGLYPLSAQACKFAGQEVLGRS
ncbi:hypothetical protein T484DRAFT_2655787 [Baffinella frigidus]|nr:hypothetical protein T484DRAFT_2655787 [Cryptophyta sp. CCMP2293]